MIKHELFSRLAPFQQWAVTRLLQKKRASLWGDMGIGKTWILLALISDSIFKGKKILIISTPKISRDTWPQEAKLLDTSFDIIPLAGKPAERLALLEQKKFRSRLVHTISFELVPWLVKTLRKQWPYDVVIVDEASKLGGFRLKNSALMPAALQKIAKQTPWWYNATGTPVINSYLRLWGQQWFIDFGEALGSSFTEYSFRYFHIETSRKNGARYATTIKDEAHHEILRAIAPNTIILKADDYFDIAKPKVIPYFVESSATLIKYHHGMAKKNTVTIEGHKIKAANEAVTRQKCNQIASGSCYKDVENRGLAQLGEKRCVSFDNNKLKMLLEILERNPETHFLISYIHESDKDRILEFIPQDKYPIADLTPQNKLRWNNLEIPYMFIHPQSGGHGLSLQHGGHHIIFYSINWDAETHFQTIERIGPMRQLQSGYQRLVRVIYLLAKDTIEEKVVFKCLYDKSDFQQASKEYLKTLQDEGDHAVRS